VLWREVDAVQYARPPGEPGPKRKETAVTLRRVELLALLGLLILAAALRLYRLDSLPPGLHHDEAGYGMQGLQVLAGDSRIFFPSYAGREAAYPHLVAASIALLGQNVLAERLPAALAGVLLVPVIFLAGRRIYGPAGGLLAAGMVMAAPWLLHLNRIGFRANLLPLTLALWAWLLLRALDTNRRRDWLLAGAALGVTAHTYLASRFVPLLVLLFLGYLLIWHRPLLRRALPGLGWMLALAALLALPLAVHFLRFPADFGERTSQVWACAGLDAGTCVGRIGEHALGALGMVGVRGDPLMFFNLPGTPALTAELGWLFYLGLLIALWRWREPAMALLLLWWGVMVLPGVLSKDAVTNIRTIGAAGAAVLLWALPLVAFGALIVRRAAAARPWLAAGGAALLLLAAAVSGYRYFVVWGNQPDLYYHYMVYAADAATAAADTPPDTALLISDEYYRHPTYLYLAPPTAAARWFDARTGWPFPPPGTPTRVVLSAATPANPVIGLMLPGAESRDVLGPAGQYAFSDISYAGAPEPPAPERLLDASFGVVDLGGMTLIPDGEQLWVALFWTVREPALDRDLWAFVHLLDADDRLLAQHDAIGYPAREWRAGDRFVSFHKLQLPPGQSLAGLHLAVGLYDVTTGERLAPTGGAPVEGYRQIRVPLEP
jgi:4-amino-4-deoxy-L-arabinose transferase-like glycosyltransferase